MSFQEAALGYLYEAIDHMADLIRHEERQLLNFRRRLSEDDSVMTILDRTLLSDWDRHILRLKSMLSVLEMARKEEERVSNLSTDGENEIY
ncbi:MAG: hypothetical protein ACUVTD_02890 [Nitrososphaerales archaeon]